MAAEAVAADTGFTEFGVLGPLEVSRAGRSVPLGGPRQRAVLALLLLEANRVVSMDRLAEDIWAGHPPEGWAATVQTYVFHLRQALEPDRARGAAGGILVTRDRGYLLRVDREHLDAALFEQGFTAGRAALEAGRYAEAAQTLRRALELWRGPVLANLADYAFTRPEAARLEELRLAALEARIDADLAMGRHDALTAELDGLVRDHPLRERLHGQLMLALYRGGRQADALVAYRRARDLLAGELGIDPGEPLRRLHAAVLGHDPALERAGPGPGRRKARRRRCQHRRPGCFPRAGIIPPGGPGPRGAGLPPPPLPPARSNQRWPPGGRISSISAMNICRTGPWPSGTRPGSTPASSSPPRTCFSTPASRPSPASKPGRPSTTPSTAAGSSSSLGSPGQATPTCQILAAGFPSYQRYCPYTAGAKDGAWHGPDLAKAVRLAHASGTTHVPVTVWSEQVRPVGTYLVHVLRQLGYQATLREVPIDHFFATASNSRNKIQLGLTGWPPNIPSPSDYFLPVLTCRSFYQNPTSTDNLAEFCDPHADQLVSRRRRRSRPTRPPPEDCGHKRTAWSPTRLPGSRSSTGHWDLVRLRPGRELPGFPVLHRPAARPDVGPLKRATSPLGSAAMLSSWRIGMSHQNR